MTSVPTFAVVGHPNKGKSSIVSTLAHDDSVAVGPAPGTTVRCRRYPMSVDGEELYVLVDTPGFQRARRAYSLLREGGATAAERPRAVRAFLEERRNEEAFRNEVELLSPIMEGAGILYVVDGSVPYGTEYEAEMEILRWTGRPRMALINLIGEADHVGEWKAALGQYFSVVRVFDALMADSRKQTELLRAFGELEEEWREPLEEAVSVLESEWRQHRLRAARAIAETIGEMLALRVEDRLPPEASPEDLKAGLLDRYREELQKLEERCRDRVEEIYLHSEVRRSEDELEILDTGRLFSSETWSIFGLSRTQLVGFGALSGGAAGGLIDIALGGASFLLGALVGAGIGAGTAAYAADRLAEVKVLHIALGGRMLVAGPTKNVSFPHIVFERARLHRALVAGRTHAQRGDLDLRQAVEKITPPLPGVAKRRLEKAFAGIRREGDAFAAVADLTEVIAEVFANDDSYA